MLLLRNDVEATVLRLPGQLYEHKEGNIISNVFTYKLVNKTTEDIENVNFKLRKYKGKLNWFQHLIILSTCTRLSRRNFIY